MFTGFRELDRIISGKCSTLFYGEAGVGKTTMLLTIASNICGKYYPCIYISTEDTLHYERVARYSDRFINIFFTEIRSFDEFFNYILSKLIYIPYRVLFIDSINALYRLVAYSEESIAKYGLILATIWNKTCRGNGYLFASAQVRAGYRESGEVVASGMGILEYWFDNIVYMGYSDNYRYIRVVKPENGLEARYVIGEYGVEWVDE